MRRGSCLAVLTIVCDEGRSIACTASPEPRFPSRETTEGPLNLRLSSAKSQRVDAAHDHPLPDLGSADRPMGCAVGLADPPYGVSTLRLGRMARHLPFRLPGIE